MANHPETIGHGRGQQTNLLGSALSAILTKVSISCPFLKRKKDFIYLFLEKGGEKVEGATLMCGCLFTTPTGGLAHNPGMCPDWELNW